MGIFRKMALCAALLTALTIPRVQAAVPEDMFLQQAWGDSCTLCASTMMIRSCLYCAGTEDWREVTEANVRSTAWTSVGLSWNWTYAYAEHELTVGHKSTNGISAEKLRSLLLDHPEGIVLYCGGSAPHAVWITDYEAGRFYCADPANTYAGERILLSDSLLGRRHGDQSGILRAVTAYWYIAQSHILPDPPDREVCPPNVPGRTLENIPARL